MWFAKIWKWNFIQKLRSPKFTKNLNIPTFWYVDICVHIRGLEYANFSEISRYLIFEGTLKSNIIEVALIIYC